MDKSICIIESDSDNSIIVLDSPPKIKKNINFKRDLSIEGITNAQKKRLADSEEIINSFISIEPGSSKSFHNFENILQNKQIKQYNILSLKEFYISDPRLDQRLYYNRIDENENFDIQLFISSILEVMLDLICSKKIIYSIEHYYHQMYKRKKFKENNDILIKMKSEFDLVYSNKSIEEKQLSETSTLARRNYEMQIKSQEFICKFLYEDLKTFVNFILETYENKYIIP